MLIAAWLLLHLYFRWSIVFFSTLVSRCLSKYFYGVLFEKSLSQSLFQVKSGWCLDILHRRFIQNAIKPSEIGVKSPRTYIDYTYTPGRVPDPAAFRATIENSFEGETKQRFLRKLYQLLIVGKFPFKSRKLCVIGTSNSCKNTWLQPFAAVVGPHGICRVVAEGRFSMQMLTRETQLITMDEWTNSLGKIFLGIFDKIRKC